MAVDSGRALVVLDLQRVVGPGGPWEVPGIERILPSVRQLIGAFGSATVLTRHRLAHSGPGTWSAFAQRWAALDEEPEWWDLLDEVSATMPQGASLIDKHTYSAYPAPELSERLSGPATELVLAGCETDCCVAATLFAAVDAGVPVSLVENAVVGPDPESHSGLIAAARRLPEQVRVVTASEALRRPYPAGGNPQKHGAPPSERGGANE
ncbi:cysteine hydrolase [Egibacter rhizosphaerae]|uniref:Cysteine hydrolase n=1 Tax=Egibacter rhizosphaerae TaxID=1670831 RepID=A0A411YEG0_9ACTN|nr:cysteine hydrolase [Egibacter rhizosphaerae]QBI19487.1 cysteine hydrolase [Egibacter rhizosphaerae]